MEIVKMNIYKDIFLNGEKCLKSLFSTSDSYSRSIKHYSYRLSVFPGYPEPSWLPRVLLCRKK